MKLVPKTLLDLISYEQIWFIPTIAEQVNSEQ